MSHRRDRSASPDRDRSHKRSRRDRDDYDDDDRGHRDKKEKSQTIRSLAEVGAKEISADDYFLKAGEFKKWLRDEKSKYLDELSSESSRKYFKKFVKQWNSLTLPAEFYRPITSTAAPSSSLTAYKWGFASNRSKIDKDQLTSVREDVDRLTNSVNAPASSSSAGPSRAAGPTMPPRGIGPAMGPAFPSTLFSSNHTDRQLALEDAADRAKLERKGERNKYLERAEELVPKQGGREGKMEEKRANNAVNKEFREKDMGAGMEVPESTLMGAGGDFAAALAARNAASAKRTDRRAQAQAERQQVSNDRFSEMKAKDNAQMEMFKQLAKARFG